MILRIEDIDSPRVKPWARQATIDDLRWLGLDWDQGPDIGGPLAPYVQTQRMDSYRLALEKLVAQERVYPCDCTRSDIAASASAPHESLEGPIYPGRCSQRDVSYCRHLNPSDFAWRFRASHGQRSFLDGVAGYQQANVAEQLGDFIVAKGDGTPAYQLAVVVDDFHMGVTEVLRGDDLIPSSFRQLDLLAALGWPAPNYLHVPLMVGPDGRRLAKRHGDTRLSWFREAGYSAEFIVGFLASTIGLIEQPMSFSAKELVPLWEVTKKISPQPTVVDLPALLNSRS